MSPTPQGDYRTKGQHDVDRVLYSSAFRRLDGVTQVVAIGERMLLHNRLTHTLKVAQLSRRIAQWLNHSSGYQVADPDVAEAAGLAHDLGHPPFGHIAEKALNTKLAPFGVGGFEGNAQSSRVVTKLSRTGEQNRPGLHLGPRTLNAILKYPWMSNHALARTKNKWGAYLTEAQEFMTARGDDSGLERSIEAEIMDWADDISYAVHDLQDFYSAGLIPLDLLKTSPTQKADFLAKAGLEWREDWEFSQDHAQDTLQSLWQLLNPQSNEPGTMRHRSQVSRMGGQLINHYVTSAGVSEGQFVVARKMREQIFLIKQLTWQHVIQNPSLASLQRGQIRMIETLFDEVLRWLQDEKESSRLPTRLRELKTFCERDLTSGDKDAVLARAASDYICGLTEDQAIDLHDRLAGSIRGSIQDRWLAS